MKPEALCESRCAAKGYCGIYDKGAPSIADYMAVRSMLARAVKSVSILVVHFADPSLVLRILVHCQKIDIIRDAANGCAALHRCAYSVVGNDWGS